MENPEQKQGQTKNIGGAEKQERIIFAETVKKSILDTFPFDTKEQKGNFSAKFEPIIKNHDELTDIELIRNIRLVLASLENTHTKLEEKGSIKYYLEVPIFYKAHKYWVEDNSLILEVVSMDGIAIDDLMEEKMQESGGGTADYKIIRALRSLMCSQVPRSATLGVKKDGEVSVFEVPFVFKKESAVPAISRRVVRGKMLDQQTGYLQIKSWSGNVHFDGKNVADLVEEGLVPLMAAKFLILDVRENGGGDSPLAEKLAGHFIKKKTHYGTVLKRRVQTDELVRSELELKPQGIFLDKKVVVLTGPKCLSSNEMFVMMMKDTGVAETIGQATGGGSGNPKSFEISLRGKTYTLKVSSWKMIRKNGSNLEGIGIEPDVSVVTTSEDVLHHRDVELETAKEYLRRDV
ncbi:MAG: hypothetical protein COV10_03495 [Candidatus Vogelbacteria bacterium CG10_big_fil_rev_8_21_14_0_10_51_16]|uniref:Tail specific protease domain-containing protein n=1 Tax=Candidatus Vogelbacteria bacterium CG10_big_fil_rev_8_21_14_0_10_51_16 TaxID=1975045 RepID=A0A2H0RDP2_9BACT|nr:MAG: hypothetical protein COV10_03495 [Candidatus Vogelbacteria bacterium CG10_big_fil_rev_8_21_14_0_10_51_16]